eukprot:2941861-Amphidinium_carterae.1
MELCKAEPQVRVTYSICNSKAESQGGLTQNSDCASFRQFMPSFRPWPTLAFRVCTFPCNKVDVVALATAVGDAQLPSARPCDASSIADDKKVQSCVATALEKDGELVADAAQSNTAPIAVERNGTLAVWALVTLASTRAATVNLTVEDEAGQSTPAGEETPKCASGAQSQMQRLDKSSEAPVPTGPAGLGKVWLLGQIGLAD